MKKTPYLTEFIYFKKTLKIFYENVAKSKILFIFVLSKQLSGDKKGIKMNILKIAVNQKWNNQTYDCTIVRNQSITVDCLYKNAVNPMQTSTSFKIGDIAEYDSYNMSYTGNIIGITDKIVTIVAYSGSNSQETHRLKLEEFCWRNYNFDLAKTKMDNLATSYYI